MEAEEYQIKDKDGNEVLTNVSNNEVAVCQCCHGECGWYDEDGLCICPQCNGVGQADC